LRTEHSQIGSRITSDNDSRDAAAINERDSRVIDALDDVLIG
jgi:hypothetical protein